MYIQLTFSTDIDECAESTDNCDSNAECTNTIGSHNCTCTVGYTGNGRSCGMEYDIVHGYCFTHILVVTWARVLHRKYWHSCGVAPKALRTTILLSLLYKVLSKLTLLNIVANA